MINLKTIWKTFKSLIGEDAYEKYLEHHAKSHADTKNLLEKSQMQGLRVRKSGVYLT